MKSMRPFLSLLAVATCAGVVAAGMTLPAVGTGLAVADSGVKLFNSLPKELEERPLAQPSKLMTRDGKKIAEFYWQNREEVPLDAVAPAMKDATLAIEDHRFYEHGPVDLEGIARAAVKNIVSGSLHGGSTLTQQYVKNVLISNSQLEGDEKGIERARDRSGATGAARKLREVKLAVSVEEKYSKDEILGRYLNINNYSGSPNAYGVQAAARKYWSVDARDLSIAQSATLAGIVQNPTRYNPQKNPEEALERRNLVLAKMLEYGFITASEHEKAKNTGLDLRVEAKPNGCATAKDLAYFCDFIQHEIRRNPAFGATAEDRDNLLRRGGLTIRTSIDSNLQKKASKVVRQRLPIGDPSGAAQALVSVDVPTGEILAMTQNTKYQLGDEKKAGRTSVNYSVDENSGGGTGFQPGSTWKPFVLAAWLQDGRRLQDTVNGSGSNYTGFSTAGCDDRNYAASGYNPRNAGDSQGSSGEMTVLDATKHSVNKAYADMASQLNMCSIRDTATEMGVRLGDGGKLSDATLGNGTQQVLYPSSILGTVSVSPLTMAGAYTAFANRGQRCEAHGIVAVTDADDADIDIDAKKCAEVLYPDIADSVAYTLSQTFNGGTTSRLRIGEPAAAKTGTTNFEVGASWVVGFTRGISTAVWTGDPEGVRDWRSNSAGRMPRIVYGETVSGPSWRDFMDYAAPRSKTGRFDSGAEDGRSSSDSGPDAGSDSGPARNVNPPAPEEADSAGEGGDSSPGLGGR